jgi:hypothetical protein
MIPLKERPVSGSVVAERRATVEKAHPGSTKTPKIGSQSAGPEHSAGVIKKGVLQDKSQDKPAPKPRKKKSK